MALLSHLVLLASGIPVVFTGRALCDIPRTAARTSLVAAMALTWIAAACSNPIARHAITAATGHPTIWLLAAHLAAVAACACYLSTLIHWRWGGDPTASYSTRLLTANYLIVAALLTALFLAADPEPPTARPSIVTNAAVPAGAAFEAVLALVYTATAIIMVVTCLAYAYQARHAYRWLTSGLIVMAAGAALGAVDPIVKIIFLVSYHLPAAVTPNDGALQASAAEFLIAGAVVAAGAALPTLGTVITQLQTRTRNARRVADITPLWHTVVDGVPDVTLRAPMRRHRRWTLGYLRGLTADDSSWTLHRRLIEIRDGYLQVRAWMCHDAEQIADLVGRVAGLHGDDLRALTEAATLAAAIRDHRRGAPERGGTAIYPGPSDMAGEIAWLTRISAMITGPLVAEVLERLDRRPHTPPSIRLDGSDRGITVTAGAERVTFDLIARVSRHRLQQR